MRRTTLKKFLKSREMKIKHGKNAHIILYERLSILKVTLDIIEIVPHLDGVLFPRLPLPLHQNYM